MALKKEWEEMKQASQSIDSSVNNQQLNQLEVSDRFPLPKQAKQASTIKKCLRALIFARVSSVEQTTIEEQVEKCKQYCREKKYEIIEPIITGAYSTKDNKRKKGALKNPLQYMRIKKPQHSQAFQLAEQQRYDILVCYASDRLGRDFGFVVWYIINLYDMDVRIESTLQGKDLFMLFITSLIAWYENSLKSTRVISSHQKSISKGLYIGRIPTGYIREGEGQQRHWIVDTQKATLIQKIFELCKNGMSVHKIGLHVGLDHKTIQGILINPTYCGYLWNGNLNKWTKASHPAIIPIELFTEVQKKLQ